MRKLKEAVSNFGPSSVYVILRLILSFLSNKVVAVYLGPSGLALFTSIQNIVNILTTLSGGIITTGVTKLVAEEQKITRSQGILDSCIVLWLCLSGVLIIFLGLWSETIGNLDSLELTGTWFLFFVPLAALNTILLSFINGLQLNRIFVLLSLISQFLLVSLVVYFTVLNHFSGVAFGLVAGVSLGSLPTAYFLIIRGYKLNFVNPFRSREVKGTVKNLIKYSVLGLFGGFVAPFVQLIIREAIADMGGAAAAGLWQGMWKISELQTMIITSALAIYFLPKISSLTSYRAIKSVTKSTLFIAVPFVTFLSFSIYMFRESIISIILSAEFVTIGDVIGYHLLGDIFKVASWILGTILIAKGLLKEFMVSEMIFSILMYLMITTGFEFWGLMGASIGYFVNYGLHLVVMVYLVLKYFREISTKRSSDEHYI